MTLRTSLAAAVLGLACTFSIVAAEPFGAHEHGKGVLTLVVEGNEMLVAFESAAMNIVGFENKPNSAEQRAEVTAAIDIFNRADWFQFNADANCELTTAEANTDLLDTKFHHGHADFYANYQLLCQQPARLKQLQLTLFNLLPSLEQLQVQWSINGQQGATDASLRQSIIRF
ncbi:ZrgA family zinc uptake protein [Rheinheimera sp. WS51]|uniref:ZrgA family zinc uptake protein n=1 Tax=Rheinheimera sp. WS51 TaxID=3425886 RepID=UPI003D8ADFC0